MLQFIIGLFIGVFIGANAALFLYACILVGKQDDIENEFIEMKEVSSEWRKSN